MSALGSARAKARDARRQSDMRQILNAVHMYGIDNDNLPLHGGWDMSSTAGSGFMDFLSIGGYISKVPVDPVNDRSYENHNGHYSYRYYCYPTGTYKGFHLGYWRESDNKYIMVHDNFSVRPSHGGARLSNWGNSDYKCL